MEDAVEVASRRSVGIGIEPPEADVGAREDRHSKPVGLAFGQCTGAPDIGLAPVGRREAIVVGARRLEPFGKRLAAPVMLGAGSYLSACNLAGEIHRLAELEIERSVLICNESRPDEHAIRTRLATGHPMSEPASWLLRSQRGRGQADPQHPSLQKRTAIEDRKRG